MIQRKHLNILSLIMVGFLLGWSSNSLLQKNRPSPRPKVEHFKKLGLSEENLSKVLAILKEADIEKEKIDLELDMKKKVFDQSIETTKDEEKLRAAFSDFAEMRKKVTENRFEVMLKVHSHLTLDQIKKLRTFRPDRPKRK